MSNRSSDSSEFPPSSTPSSWQNLDLFVLSLTTVTFRRGRAVGGSGGGRGGDGAWHPLLKTTLTGLRRTYLRFLVFRPKLTKTKRFPPFLDHMNGKLFLGGSRFWSGKIGPKLALGGHRSQCPAELSFIFNRCPAGNPLFLTDKIYF